MSAPPVFQKVSPEINFPKAEAEILRFWKERGVFEQTLAAREGRPRFVFYEGPPTANGLPHNGHVLTRVIKDLFPRYRTMCGYDVPRKAGWDTHGLPVEVEVEKELRIHGKADIEKYGVAPFVLRCVNSVFRYTAEWERLTEKIGFWVDLPDAYVTYHRSYVESVWWALATLYKKGLLYQGHKIVWWWAQGGTALSSAEVGSNYKTVDDPSCYVAMRLLDEPDAYLLVWTTTPWTLPSNMYAAVKADVEYVYVDDGDHKLVMAAALRPEIEKKLKRETPVVKTVLGRDLVGKRYEPPFTFYWKRGYGGALVRRKDKSSAVYCYRVVAADFVTLDTGTGIVHIAPAFGEDDYDRFRKEQETFDPSDETGRQAPLCSVKPDGTFDDEFSPEVEGIEVRGKWVKDADEPLLRALKARGVLIHKEQCRHDYPFCWRSDDDPLIQYARPAWYIRTTEKKDEALANNRAVHWLPEHIREGRMGDFLANNVDWALSRERYWGTPLPLWKNDKTGEIEAIGSLDELRNKAGSNLAEIEAELAAQATSEAREGRSFPAADLIVHKPWIDRVVYGKSETGRFVRVPEVIDCWFDSGSMPFAQWGFPHVAGSKDKFDRAFPADFISEAIDQTRGWFYSLLMIATLLFDQETMKELGLEPRPLPRPYRTCMVLGHVSDKEGKKESKSKGNYTPPEVILEQVAMDFAVLAEHPDVPATAGEAKIAREDLEGLDLTDGATVCVVRPDRPDVTRQLVVRAAKKLPRRVVVLSPGDKAALSVVPNPHGTDVKPVEVPRLDPASRVTVLDKTTPAPGADAFRWFFYAASPPWTNTRHSLSNVRALQKEFPLKLRNVYSFFTIYAALDGFSPAEGFVPAQDVDLPSALRAHPAYRPVRDRSLLDRWILSELAATVASVRAHLDAYRVYEAAQRLTDFGEALSNWYVRRSRDRFWAAKQVDGTLGRDKTDAYMTLYEALVTASLLAAPFIPFMAEEMYQNLVRGPFPNLPESVHLSLYPEPDRGVVDARLAEEMAAVRELVSLGLSVRTNAKIRVRQPLGQADIVLAKEELRERLANPSLLSLVKEELNVERVLFKKSGEEGDEVHYRLKPNFRALGPKLGKKVQVAKKLLEQADAGKLRVELGLRGKIVLDLEGDEVEIGPDEIDVAIDASEGFAAAASGVGVVVLHTQLTDELLDQGLAREILSRVQGLRKELSLGYAERITVAVSGSERVQRVVRERGALIVSEALVSGAIEIGPASFAVAASSDADLGGEPIRVDLGRIA
jgi:isoleucyl-tRNA synthetase